MVPCSTSCLTVVVVYCADGTSFERLPCVLSAAHYVDEQTLASAVRDVIESDDRTDDAKVKKLCGGRGKRGTQTAGGKEAGGGVINASDIKKEDLHNFLKKTPRRSAQ